MRWGRKRKGTTHTQKSKRAAAAATIDRTHARTLEINGGGDPKLHDWCFSKREFHHPLSYSIEKEDTPWTYTFRPNTLELNPGLKENVFRCIHKDCNVTFIGQPNKRLDAAIYLHLWKDHDKQQCIFRTKKVKSKIGDMYSLNEVYNPEEKKWF